jgi:hypothetical protein
MTQDRTRLRELFDELHSVGKQCDDPNLRTLIVGAATVLIAQDDERAALQAERDAMERERDEARARAEVAQAGFAAAVGKAQWQAVTNRELNEARDAIDGLRADATRATNQALEELARADALKAERDALAALLRETLQPGAYGIGSTLAQRISDALNGAKGAT